MLADGLEGCFRPVRNGHSRSVVTSVVGVGYHLPVEVMVTKCYSSGATNSSEPELPAAPCQIAKRPRDPTPSASNLAPSLEGARR